ncbi:MAG TPA: transposase [Armatimonadota bacterium]|nr:transposase [Armatimonadota bacterium]
MPYDPERHHRRSIRLKDYDYSQAGAYFVTICTRGQECVFGEIEDGMIRLNSLGLIVRACWDDLPRHYVHVELDAFVIMPNHIHGIVLFQDPPSVGAGLRPAPTPASTDGRRHGLPEFVRAFKSFASRRINELRSTPGVRVWQRNYYEHIIRSRKSLDAIRRYVEDNPIQWPFDSEHPANIRT